MVVCKGNNLMEFQKIAGTNTCSLTKGDDVSRVVIPNHYEGMPVVEIGDFAFSRFENLQSIILPETIQKLGIGAFSSCKKLDTITIPTKVKIIQESCFSNCSRLDSFDFLMNNLRFQLSKQRIAMVRRHHDLYCVECGYVHPGDAGLEEGDICPDCGRGILIEI
jgi:hypothetical protein